MFTNKKFVVICDVNQEQDPDTLDPIYEVVSATQCMTSEELVGIQTQQLAQIQNMNFNYSIVVDRMFYNEQKYLWMGNRLYEIKNASPAKLPKDCKLQVVALQDGDIEQAIREYLENASVSSQG